MRIAILAAAKKDSNLTIVWLKFKGTKAVTVKDSKNSLKINKGDVFELSWDDESYYVTNQEMGPKKRIAVSERRGEGLYENSSKLRQPPLKTKLVQKHEPKPLTSPQQKKEKEPEKVAIPVQIVAPQKEAEPLRKVTPKEVYTQLKKDVYAIAKPDRENVELFDYRSKDRMVKIGLTAELRNWGEWVYPDNMEDDEGDYDYKILSDEYSDKLDKLLEKYNQQYSHLKFSFGVSEKNWLNINIQEK